MLGDRGVQSNPSPGTRWSRGGCIRRGRESHAVVRSVGLLLRVRASASRASDPRASASRASTPRFPTPRASDPAGRKPRASDPAGVGLAGFRPAVSRPAVSDPAVSRPAGVGLAGFRPRGRRPRGLPTRGIPTRGFRPRGLPTPRFPTPRFPDHPNKLIPVWEVGCRFGPGRHRVHARAVARRGWPGPKGASRRSPMRKGRLDRPLAVRSIRKVAAGRPEPRVRGAPRRAAERAGRPAPRVRGAAERGGCGRARRSAAAERGGAPRRAARSHPSGQSRRPSWFA